MNTDKTENNKLSHLFFFYFSVQSKNVSRQLTATFYADTTTRAQQRRTEAVVKRAAAFVCRVWRFNECFLSHNHELV